MKKISLSIIVIYSLFFVTACPKETAVRRAAKASYELSGLTLDVVNATSRAYTNGLIDMQTKDKLANALKKLSIGGMVFNQALKQVIDESNGDESKIPPKAMTILNKLFSDEVVVPLLDILQSIKVLSPERADYLHLAIATLRTAVLTISSGFSVMKAGNPFNSEVNVYV